MTVWMRLAAAGLLGMALAQPVHASESLETRAIKALFPGTFHAVVNGWASVSFIARGDGLLVGRYRSKIDTGRWSVRDGQLCITLNDWLKGRTACSPVIQDGDWYRAENVRFRKL